MFVPSTTTWLMPMTGIRMSPIGSPSAGAPCGRRGDGRPGRQLVERGLLGQGVADGVAVGLLLQLGAQPGLGVGLLHRGAPDLVRREQEQQDAEPDEDPPDDVDDPS